MKKILLTLIAFFLLLTPSFAQETPTTDIEKERIQMLKSELGVTIPLETDNPNHIITFKDPSGKGVSLEVDGQGFKTIKSPYTLPSLGIGNHILTFKFTDKQSSPQTLEQNLVIVPRVPVLSAPEKISKNNITIKGTALAGSEVELFISGDTVNYKGMANVETDGSWSYTFKENFKNSVYTVVGITKKNGFSSDFSEPLVFEVGGKNDVVNDNKNIQPIYFNFSQITPNNLVSTVQTNPHLAILVIASLILGAVIALLFESASSRQLNKKAEGKFLHLLNEKEKVSTKEKKAIAKDKDGKKLTLKEKFEKAGFKLPEMEQKDKELSKEEFMEAYKEQDPDNNKGVEKKETPKLDKKKVAVSLTSKK